MPGKWSMKMLWLRRSDRSVSRLIPRQDITDISTILGTAALNTAMGGTPSHDSSEDGFSVQIKSKHLSGEKYTVTDM
ncbi:hypothetical protein DSECCO2_51980 [anaerobic digester metagenome]